MSDGVALVIGAVLLSGILVSYALLLRQDILQRVQKARRSAARLTRDRAVELVRHHASVAPPNYQTLYANLAKRLEEMSLE